jgi:ABC-type branched-subunit amino acid transport system substrate-binding protein
MATISWPASWLKVDEINKAGGINGAMIEIVKGDDLCAPKEAGTVGTKFANDQDIVAVIGHVCSSATLAALPSYVRKGLPFISATSTAAGIGKASKDKSGNTAGSSATATPTTTRRVLGEVRHQGSGPEKSGRIP